MAREWRAHMTADGASTVIASDSEATQTKQQLETPSLGRFALLAMTKNAPVGAVSPAMHIREN